jgi:predicted transport protein
MDLYKLNKAKLEEIKNLPFKLEKDIQLLVEENLEVLFGLEFIRTEFELNKLRIDSLAFDHQSKSFVIIEYKKGKSYSVIDQGYSYLSLLLNNKADFILEYLERTNKSLKKDDVDWSQSRVIFISPQFTTYQKQSIEFKDLPFELWEIRKYSNDTIILNQYKSSSQESVKNIESKDERTAQVSKEIVVYTESEHLERGSYSTVELYQEIKDRLLNFGDMEISLTKYYIAFKYGKKIISDLELQKKQLRIRINLKWGQLDDPKALFENVSDKGHWGVGDYEAKINSDTDLDYLMSLIRQSYQFHS